MGDLQQDLQAVKQLRQWMGERDGMPYSIKNLHREKEKALEAYVNGEKRRMGLKEPKVDRSESQRLQNGLVLTESIESLEVPSVFRILGVIVFLLGIVIDILFLGNAMVDLHGFDVALLFGFGMIIGVVLLTGAVMRLICLCQKHPIALIVWGCVATGVGLISILWLIYMIYYRFPQFIPVLEALQNEKTILFASCAHIALEFLIIFIALITSIIKMKRYNAKKKNIEKQNDEIWKKIHEVDTKEYGIYRREMADYEKKSGEIAYRCKSHPNEAMQELAFEIDTMEARERELNSLISKCKIVSDDDKNIDTLDFLINQIETGRASSLKEALQRWDDERRRRLDADLAQIDRILQDRRYREQQEQYERDRWQQMAHNRRMEEEQEAHNRRMEWEQRDHNRRVEEELNKINRY